jgi:hypothetical protein
MLHILTRTLEKHENNDLVSEENATPENPLVERIQKNAQRQRPKDEFLVAVAAGDPIFLGHAVTMTEAGVTFQTEPTRSLDLR